VFLNSIGQVGLALFPPDTLSLAPYFAIPERWWLAFWNSLVLAVATALISCALGTAAALGLTRGGFRRRALIDGLLRSPIQVPALVVGVAFLQYYSWLSLRTGLDFRASFPGLLIAHCAVSVPYALTIVLSRLATFDGRLEEAAFGLGASRTRTLLTVTLPIIAPAIGSAGFFAFLLSLDNVPISLFLVTRSMPLLPVDLFAAIQFDLTRTIYALSTLVCILTTTLTVVLYRRLPAIAAIGRT
jgi:putative spermidine/putrescine transport system permease protein